MFRRFDTYPPYQVDVVANILSSATHAGLPASSPRNGPTLTGYARVPTDDQDLTLQRVALNDAGCKRIFEEKASGAKRDRPELARMLEQLRDGDIVVVTRLDRLARSTRDLLDTAERLREAGAGLRSVAEPWADTTSPVNRR